jgi:phage terminase large subunit-like protein
VTRQSKKTANADTLRVWQPRTDRELGIDDIREIERNVAGFFAVLRDWSRAEQEQDEPPGTSVSSINSTDQEINK